MTMNIKLRRVGLFTMVTVACVAACFLTMSFTRVQNAFAAGPYVHGSEWLGGQGVCVAENPPPDWYEGKTTQTAYTKCDGESVYSGELVGATRSEPWQCEELPARLWAAKGWYAGGWTGNAYELYGTGWGGSAVKDHANNGAYTPVPGDLLVHAANDGFAFGAGHVAVVDSVIGSVMTVREQNVPTVYETAKGTATYVLSGGRWVRQGTSVAPEGFVHAVNDKLTTGGSSPPLLSSPSFLPPGAINRYYDAQTHDHWVTSGGTPAAGYEFEGTLGFGALDPGPNEQTLYSCDASGDHFVSVDPGCEGRTALGAIGVAYSRPPTTGLQSLAIYRCTVNGTGDHFVSVDPGCEGQHTEGPLGYLTASQDRFNRYVASSGDHIDTARGVGANARLEGTLGFVAPNGGAGRRAMYSCTAGADQFTSADPGCEGQTVIGLDGWVYTSPGRGWPQTAAIYRCIVNGSGDHFVSIDPGCEGQRSEGPLGYIAQTHPALDRFYDPQTKDHWITAGIVPNGYQFEGRLGYMLQAGGSGRHALYSCMIGTDQFTSANANCEGQRVLGQDGWAYNTAPHGLQTTPIYRCTVNGSGEHFVSADSGCEGQHTEGRLGYIASTPGGA